MQFTFFIKKFANYINITKLLPRQIISSDLFHLQHDKLYQKQTVFQQQVFALLP